jgi:hypothetical protein
VLMVDVTRRVSLGACRCPGQPHAEDEAVVSLDRARAAAEGIAHAGDTGLSRIVIASVLSWNRLDAEGEPLPIDPQTVDGLVSVAVFEVLNEAVDWQAAKEWPNRVPDTILWLRSSGALTAFNEDADAAMRAVASGAIDAPVWVQVTVREALADVDDDEPARPN